MTEPTSQFFTPDLVDQYKKILGSNAVFTTRPNIAAALAQASPDRDTTDVVGGFLESLDLAKQVRLTRAGGAKLFLSARDKAYLDMLGEDYSDVDGAPLVKAIDAQQKATSDAGKAQATTESAIQVPESHGLLGHVAAVAKGAAHFAADVADASGVHQVLGGLSAAADATRGLVRTGSMLGLFGGTPNYKDLEENLAGASDRGYNIGNPLDVIAFWSQGDQVYHNLDDLRKDYGSGQVKAAQDYLENPAAFEITPDLTDDQITQRIQATNDPRWKELVAKVDSRHMSLGRDAARTFGLDPGTKPFTAVSGSMDALESWFVDPTVIGGKVLAAQKLNKLALNSLVDEQGIRRVMDNNPGVQRGFQMLLDKAKVIREGTDTEAGAAYAELRSAVPSLLPLVDEINGKVPVVVNRTAKLAAGVQGPERLIKSTIEFQHQAPIESMDQLTEYLVNKDALTRALRGAAPKVGVYMPGSVSRFAATKAGVVGQVALRTGQMHEDRIIDLTKDAAKVLATPGNAVGGPLAAAEVRGDAIAKADKDFRSRFLRTAKRFSALVPNETKMDFYDPRASDMVYKWAAGVMPKAEARLIAARFSAADLAGRRTIYKGMMEQAIHASGLESSTTGKALAAKMRGDLVKADTQQYSLVPDADLLVDESGARHVAVMPGQVSTEMWLPGFPELNKAAAKVSMYDYTLKRVADNVVTEKLMQTLRAGWLFTSAGAVRNIIEGWAGAAASGLGWDAFKGRLALSQQKAARAVERELPEGAPAPYKTEAGYHAARIKRVLGYIHQAKGSALSRITGDEFSDAADILGEEIAQGHLSKLGLNPTALVTGVADPRNLDDVAEITRMGARPAEIAFKQWELKGWGEVASKGEAGARNWAHNLDQVVGETPVLGQRLVDVIRGQHGTTKGVGSIVPDARLERLALHIVEHPEMEKYREFAELARPLKTAITQEQKLEIAHSIADRMVKSFGALVLDKDGNPIHALLDRLERGEVPSLDWFAKHVPYSMRPEHVLGRSWAPVSAKPDRSGLLGLGQMAGRGYTQFLSRGYETVVSKPIAKLSSEPIFLGNFVKARRNLAGYEERLIDQGMAPEAAKLHSTKLALDHAMDMTSRMIDNPEVASQMATISRNLVNFPRAAEDWVRRWARITKEDPTVIRKVQMAIEGGQHSGVIDRDDQGNLIFTYPGSGAVINAVLKVGETLHIPGIAAIPTVPDLKSQVMFLNPSLNNPFFPGASPLITTPVQIAQGLFPESRLMLQDLNTGLTGDDRGASQGILEQFVPSVVRNMFAALTADEQSAQLSSAAMNAIVHLDAAGLSPPPNATPDEVDQYLQRVKTAAKNQLIMRAIFAFALPATPSLPENDTAGDSSKSDALFAAEGLSSLKDEARTLVAKLGYERALAVWTKLHPDDLAFMVGRTQSGGPYGAVSPTRHAELWIEQNRDLVKEFPSVAAYFVPDTPGDFSPEAYRSQLESGLRTRKDLHTFYQDVRIINAEREYYEVRDRRDTEIAKAKAAGDTDGVNRAKAIWSAWTQGDGNEPGFLNLNPLFAQKLANYGERTVWREQAVGELSKLVQSGNFAGGADISTSTQQSISDMIQAYRSHTAFTDKMRGKRDKESLAAKDNEQRAYEKHMLSLTGAHYDENGRLVGGDSAVRDIYQGLFRGLD